MKNLRLALVLALIFSVMGVLKAQESFRLLELEIALDEDYSTAAVLRLPAEEAESYPTVILFHGTGPWDMDAAYTDGTITSSNFRLIAETLASEGIAVLTFNKRGALGNGEYDMEQAQKGAFFSQVLSDAETVLAFAQEQAEIGEIYLYGWSEGAWVVSHLAANHPEEIAGLILQAPPNSPITDILVYQHLEMGMNYLAEEIDSDASGGLSIEEAQSIPSGPISLMAAYYIFPPAFNPEAPMFSIFSDTNQDGELELEAELRPAIERTLEMMRGYDDGLSRVITDILAESSLPILILHGDTDGYVPLAEGQEIADAFPETTSLMVYEGLGHALSPTSHPAEDAFGVMEEIALRDLIDWLQAE